MFNLPNEDLLEISSDLCTLNSFRNKSFLVTGGTGFIGKWIVASLNFLNTNNDANISITILTRNKKSFIDKHSEIKKLKNLYFVESDVKDLDKLNYEGKEFDYIVIGANDATYDFSLNAYNLTNTLINGTKNILDKFVSIKTTSILHLSSGAVYGDISEYQDGVKEESNASFDINNIGSMYGLSKILVESVLNEFGKTNNIKIINARCFAFSGPYLPIDKHFAFGNFIRNALENEDIIIAGDGSPVRSYLYPTDLVNFLFKLLEIKDANITVNIGSSEAVSIKNLADKIKDVLNLSKDVIVEKSNVNHPEKSNYYIPNINKANKLGLIESISLKNSIIKTYDFYKKLYF